ncbi:uncharacterized protein LOC134259586 [Saccostrea cucullata]|uniref:uncharacterized protein LOC134259586 n=1 Tax=Saccostrea cuccullata TaxID=36930 RepID=UPI002ED3E0B1
MERCKHWLAVKRIDSNDNADGLRMLMDHRRCNIQPFDCKAWLDLMGILHIQSPEFEQIYMYQNDGNDRSREKEDTLLQKDLNLITDQEMCMEEEVFYQLFSLQGTMIIVYIVNNENRARFSTRAFHGETKDEEEFRRDLEKTYTLKKESEEMHVDIYMLLNDNRCRMLTNFLRQHRKAFFRIYATELGRFQKTSLRQLMDHERCKVNALEFQTWSSLISILGPPIPDFEEEYKSRREKEDIYIKKELTDIYNQDQ